MVKSLLVLAFAALANAKWTQESLAHDYSKSDSKTVAEGIKNTL